MNILGRISCFTNAYIMLVTVLINIPPVKVKVYCFPTFFAVAKKKLGEERSISYLTVTSSCTQMFFKIGVLENFTNFTGKHLCWSIFFNKVASLRPETLLKETPTQRFSCEISEIFKKTFSLQNTSCYCFWTVQNHI